MNDSERTTSLPRSMRRKRILDVAEDNPDASLEAIASEVPSATIDLVKRVLDEHGDPADEQTQQSGEEMAKAVTSPDPDELSEKQKEALRAIHENPGATQRELATILDVSSATINNRVNAIDGFSWDNRRNFVESVFDSQADMASDTSHNPEPIEIENDFQERMEQLHNHVARLERQIDELARTNDPQVLETPELVHKIVHACMKSERITEKEELQILKELLRG